jgi:predicted DNA-binding antitoxin AbrB/MazE fold protein
MTTTVEAISENGMLRLSGPLPLREKAQVLVTIQTEPLTAEDKERQAWLKASEETLTRAWDNSADDVFNELLDAPNVRFFECGGLPPLWQSGSNISAHK